MRGPLDRDDRFSRRHLGPGAESVAEMLEALGCASLDSLISETVPASIRGEPLAGVGEGLSEPQLLARLREIAAENLPFRSYLGMGYHDTVVPSVILRTVLENPGWYTAYTPYQAEISQGRLEALLNFQTVVADLTGLPIANASLLDEGTAAAEAMSLFLGEGDGSRRVFLVDPGCHPQTIEVVRGRALPLGIEVRVENPAEASLDPAPFGVLLAYPRTDGEVADLRSTIDRVHQAGGLVAVAAELLALTLLVPPGEFGADVAVGSTQRFGVQE